MKFCFNRSVLPISGWACVLFLCLISCTSPVRKNNIVILYDNDVHCAIAGYEKMAALRTQMLDSTKFVAVVSAGDFIQGNIIGNLSKGEYIVDIMNSVPYDYITIGNHEFDYNVPQLLKLTKQLKARTLCCNVERLGDKAEQPGQMLFPAYAVKNYGGTKVAFVGVATPTTFNTSTPTFFLNEAGKVVYDFHAGSTFALIQEAVDKARSEGAEYIIVLSHLGDDTEVDNSVNMIAATHGIDAVIDGHQHHIIPCRKIADASGDSVILTSTGTGFQYIGQLVISPEGVLSTTLIETASYEGTNAKTLSRINQAKANAEKEEMRVVGYTPFPLTDADAAGERLVRRGETNLSDFVADAMRFVTGADIGVVHGGGIRAALPAGDLTYGLIVSVFPFNNWMAKIEMTGRQLMDCMEVGVREWPKENGDFHIASGLRYTIDPSIPSSVLFDENNLFAGVGNTRRIVSMEVLLNGIWTPVDPERTYTVGGLDYTLVNKGASGMFAEGVPVPFEPIKDTEAILQYLHSLGDTIPAAYAEPHGVFAVKK